MNTASTSTTSPAGSEPSQPAPRPRRLRKWLVRAAVLLVVLLVAAELFSRFYLGLGDPPLSMADPEVEYRFVPGDYRRFGNHVSYNAYSMRSGPVTPEKTDPAQLRVLVVGDSVVNGGAQTDDGRLATAILQSRLADALGRPVYVANISAGSWGPPNELAYLKKFGLFDADCLVLVVSSHDYADAPDFKPIVDVNPSFPGHRPPLALQEAVTRYLLPRITHSHEPADPGTVAPKTPDKKDVDWCLDSTRQIIRLARDQGIPVIVAQHAERGELRPDAPEPTGHALLGEAARDEHADPVQLAPPFRAAVDAGQDPYRDYIHPNALGQQIIADTLYPLVLRELRGRVAHPAATRPISAEATAATQPTR